MDWWVYILKSDRTGRYYIGHTGDVDARLEYHNAGRVASTKAYRPWTVAYTDAFETKAQACRRERELKSKKSRTWLEENLLTQSAAGGAAGQKFSPSRK